MTQKEEILAKEVEGTTARNSMGCNESWYSAYYAIQHTFTREEIEKMSDSEVDNLVKLAETLGDAFY